jgi:hypothetical protein
MAFSSASWAHEPPATEQAAEPHEPEPEPEPELAEPEQEAPRHKSNGHDTKRDYSQASNPRAGVSRPICTKIIMEILTRELKNGARQRWHRRNIHKAFGCKAIGY